LKILAIDPGPLQSAYVVLDGRNIHDKGIVLNADLSAMIPGQIHSHFLYIEMIESYGMPVGKTTFDTCVWIGRFIERYYSKYSNPDYKEHYLVYRKDIKILLQI